MAKPRAKSPNIDSSQTTLWELLDQQPNQLVEWSFEPDDIGGELLGILSKGLYPDPLDCIREYVQNSVDARAKNVTIKITGNSVIIRDDGMGMDLEGLVQSRRLGLSNKSRAENVGFRGIGIYSGFDICSRLLVTTKAAGESKARVLEFDFGEMKAQLKREQDSQSLRTSLTKLLTKYSHFKQEEDQIDRHYTIVQLEELSRVHIGQLADHERLRAYMLHNLPIDFADTFPYKDQINSQLENHVPGYNAIRVKLVTDFAPPEVIVKPNVPNLREPIMSLVHNSDGKKIAYYWACLHAKGEGIPEEYAEYRGLVYKVKGFTIGNRSPLRAYFTTAKGTLYHWYTGEVYVIDENVIPNAARNDFETSQEKLQLEAAVGEEMRELNKAAVKFQEQKNANKDFEKASSYLDDLEKKVGSFNPKQCSDEHLQLERYLDNLRKKQKKTTFNQNYVQETIRRAEQLKSIVRQMIDHPEGTSNQSTDSKILSVDSMSPSPIAKSPAGSFTTMPKHNPMAASSSPEPILKAAPPTVATPNVAPPLTPSLVKTLVQVFEQSGLDIGENCQQMLRIIDSSLSSILARETYERVLDDLEARLDYEVTGEVESEDE